jgi:hypothetical protein
MLFKGGGIRSVAMPKGLHRRYGLRHLHFITSSCYRRLPLLSSARARNLLVKILGEVRGRYGFALTGYVVMTQSHSLAHRRASPGHSFARAAGPEAARLAATPPQAPQKVGL